MSLSVQKQLFLQCLMSRRIVDGTQALQILESCLGELSPETSVDEFVRQINTALKPYRMQIAKGADEETGIEYYAFVNLVDSEISRMSTLHKKEHYEYFKKVITAIFSAEDYCLSQNSAINLSFLLSENNIRLKLSEAEDLLNKWIDEKYFSVTDNGTKIYFGVRSILEMQSYFREFYSSYIGDCNLCNTLCIRGICCDKCSAKFHFRCARKCYEINKHCAQCKDPWSEELFLNTRDSSECSTQSESIEPRNRSGKRKRNVRN